MSCNWATACLTSARSTSRPTASPRGARPRRRRRHPAVRLRCRRQQRRPGFRPEPGGAHRRRRGGQHRPHGHRGSAATGRSSSKAGTSKRRRSPARTGRAAWASRRSAPISTSAASPLRTIRTEGGDARQRQLDERLVGRCYSFNKAIGGSIFDASGTAVRRDFAVSVSGTATSPDIASDGSSLFVVTWVSSQMGTQDIYAGLFNSAGAIIGSEFRVTEETPPPPPATRKPRVAMNASGDFVVTWSGKGQAIAMVCSPDASKEMALPTAISSTSIP